MPAPEIPIHRPSIGAEELAAIASVLESRWLGMGGVTRELEQQIGELVGARHVVAVASGSAALHVALLACEVGPGDEVIVPSLTFVSCPQAILAVGAMPVFCEVDPATATIDPSDVARRITPRTRAVMPVHYAGFPARMDELQAITAGRGIRLVEDGAHAFGSAFQGRPVGSIGDATCFSFDPVKNVTTGEGGAVTTNDDALAERARLAANLGVGDDSWQRRNALRPWHYEATVPGFRYHLLDLNAAVGLVQLGRLDERRERKRALFRRYRDGLDALSGLALVTGDVESAFPFLCVVRVLHGSRDALLAHLGEHGIQAWVHFVPAHLQPAFAEHSEPLPVTERLYDELLTLPLYADLANEDVDRVVDCVAGFFGRS